MLIIEYQLLVKLNGTQIFTTAKMYCNTYAMLAIIVIFGTYIINTY